jgi:CspA family cold shock protein
MVDTYHDLRSRAKQPMPEGSHRLKRPLPMSRLTGTVKFFNNAKGFGFITPDEGGKDVFVHATAVEASNIPAIGEGDRVSFDLEDDPRGRGEKAVRLKQA